MESDIYLLGAIVLGVVVVLSWAGRNGRGKRGRDPGKRGRDPGNAMLYDDFDDDHYRHHDQVDDDGDDDGGGDDGGGDD